jgi:hypothetical protein
MFIIPRGAGSVKYFLSENSWYFLESGSFLPFADDFYNIQAEGRFVNPFDHIFSTVSWLAMLCKKSYNI